MAGQPVRAEGGAEGAPDEAAARAGIAALAAGRHEEAASCFAAAAAARPEAAAHHANLGTALHRLGRAEEALAALDRALALDPDGAVAHHTRGQVLFGLRRYAAAAEAARTAARSLPDNVGVAFALARALDHADRLEEAEAVYRRVLALDPGHAGGRRALALLRLAAGAVDEALALFREATRRERGPQAALPEGERVTNLGKLRHDRDQLRYLRGIARLPEAADRLIAGYEALIGAIDPALPAATRITLDARAMDRLGGAYNRIVHRADAPALAENPLGPGLDPAALEATYRASPPGLAVVDGVLSDAALAALRRFCTESTIYVHIKHGGYVGAYLPEVACGLLLQLANALPRLMPQVFAGHRLRHLWAYKYDSELEGIGTHADFAAVNVNLWITPDEANLDPARGGLVIHRVEAPGDWDFRTYNEDEEAIGRHLAAAGAEAVTVPYRANRAVIFHSDLFHATDRFRFRDRYPDRRVNITFLYGDRHG